MLVDLAENVMFVMFSQKFETVFVKICDAILANGK